MHATQSIAVMAALASMASAQVMGFNSGATLDTYKVKVQSDYEAEFTTAQGLVGAPGKMNSVRLYTMIQGGTDTDPTSAFAAAIKTNTTMLLGIWCSGTTTIQKELTALSSAITQYGTKFTDLVVGISVGSEDLYRTSVQGVINKSGIGNSPDAIVNFIKDTRKAIANTPLSGVPVGHVDTWTDWTNSSNKAVIDAVDFIGNDLYPYYQSTKDNSIANAADLFNEAQEATMAAAGGKPVWITETGWPTSGPIWGKASSSPANAQEYWETVGCKLFGKTNVWWYNLRDSNPDNEAKFAITSQLSTTPLFNLTCPVNVKKPNGGDGTSNNTSSGSASSSATFPGSTGTIGNSNGGGSNGSFSSGGSSNGSFTTGGASGTIGGAGGAGAAGPASSSPVATGVASSVGAMMGLTMCILLGSASFLL